MRPFLILLFFILLSGVATTSLKAQKERPLMITGQVLESSSQAPIEYATVILKDAESGAVIGGETTDLEGRFKLKAPQQEVSIEISFIGFQSTEVKELSFSQGKADVGVIMLLADSQTLDEIVVRAEKSTTEFKLDKRVFNVGQDLSSTGASAMEVLDNVPSVNVSIEGEVSLRGSTGVQILINGKPSILADDSSNALGTITAEMIEKVEVITNPGAKYEAEGTAGIINIILKSEDKKGLNGSVSINGGVPDNHSIGISLNRRSEKFNLFTQMGAGYRSLPTDRAVNNLNKVDLTEVNTVGEEFRNEIFYNLVLGADYYINKLNVITLSGSFALEDESQPSLTRFDFLDETKTVVSRWDRVEETTAINPKLQYELKYSKDFEDDKDHQLLFSAIGRYFGKELTSAFTNTATFGMINIGDQQTDTDFREGKYTFNVDYTKPFDDKWTLETGLQYLVNNVSNDFAVSDFIDGVLTPNVGLTNVFEYDQNVLGIYSTVAHEGSIWGLKLGLRVENTDLQTKLVTTNENNQQKFTNLFPSAHASYKFSDAISFQAGYSRRIFRPRLWDLNPFFNIRNNFSIRQGNPALLPEYTDSYEVGSIFIFDKTSFNFSIYQKNTFNKIERISFFEDNVVITKPLNIGSNKSTGLELNFKHDLTKKITLSGDANYNYFSRNGQFNDVNFDFNGDFWSGKLRSKFKISKPLEFELTGNYQSRERTIQGQKSDNIFAGLGVRYKLLKGRGVFSFGVRDVFASRVDERFADQEDFLATSRSQRGRFMTLGFSYGFGKGEAMEYSGRRRR